MLSNRYKNIFRVTQERRVFFESDRPEQIWKEVVDKDAEDMKNLCQAMSRLVYDVGVPKCLVHLSAKLLYAAVYKKRGHYTKESDYLASRCRICPRL